MVITKEEVIQKLKNSDCYTIYNLFKTHLELEAKQTEIEIKSNPSCLTDINNASLNSIMLSKLMKETDDIKIFKMEDKFDYMFSNTAIPKIKEELKAPFKYIFLSISKEVKKNELLCGVLLINIDNTNNDGGVINVSSNSKIDNIYNSKNFMMVLGLFLDTTSGNAHISYQTFDNKSGLNWIDNTKLDYEDKYIRDYVINFLYFMNEPRVVTYILNPNNKRREKKGLTPIPSLLKTKITPELMEYINITYESHSKLGYAFDVRGHWRILQDSRYGDNIGKRIWIAPFIKGEGIKPPQIFCVCEK